MAEKKEVTVHVAESTYEEWRVAAERDYDGLSDLVRTAVRRELDGDHDGTTVEDLSISEVLEYLRNPYD